MKMTWLEKRMVNGSGRSRSVARGAIRRLRPLNPLPGQTYLDCGCGNGAATIEVAAEFGLRVIGLDVDPEQIELAKARPSTASAHFEIADGERLPFADGEFDFVAAHRVTHHIPRWQSALDEMMRVLAPGGRLIFTDFVAPLWAARLGQRMLGESLGFPTREGIEAGARLWGLAPIVIRDSVLNLDAVWQRPAEPHPPTLGQSECG